MLSGLVLSSASMLLAQENDAAAEFLACYEKRDFKCAEDVAAREMKQHPKNPLSWLLKAEVHRYNQELDKALESYNEALKLAPDDKQTLSQRATLLMQMDDRQSEGLNDFKRLYDMNSEGFEENLNVGATLVFLKRHKEALPYLIKAMELNPANKMVKVNLATAYRATGEHQSEADKLWQEIAVENPEAYGQFGKSEG